MNKSKHLLFWPLLILALAIIQYLTGNFPYSFFRFPLNIVVGLLWIYGIWISAKDVNISKKVNLGEDIISFLMSGKTTFVTLLLLVAGSLIIGLFPQISEYDASQMNGLTGKLGFYNFMSSWIFVGIIVVLLTHLGLITVRAILHRKKMRWRFILNHAGLWIALFAGFMGSSDTISMRMPVFFGNENNEAYTMEGEKRYLKYNISLNNFDAEYYENGSPKNYEAEILISDNEGKKITKTTLKVNHPYSYNWGEDIYLSGYDMKSSKPQYCILQIVSHPWKYIQLIGIVMTLLGGIGMFVYGPQKRKTAQ